MVRRFNNEMRTVLVILLLVTSVGCKERSNLKRVDSDPSIFSVVTKDSAYHQMIDTLVRRVVGFDREQNNVYFEFPLNKSQVLEELLRDSLDLKGLNKKERELIWKSIHQTDTIDFSRDLLSQPALNVLNKKDVEGKIIVGVSNAFINTEDSTAVLLVTRAYVYENRRGLRGGWEEFDFFELKDKWVLTKSLQYVEY